MIIETRSRYTKLTAEQGKVLTSGSEARMFVHSVCTTTPEMWEEWTEEAMNEWKEEHPQEEEE